MKSLAGYMMNAMKNLISPNNLIWVGIAFVTLGFLLPFLTVLGVFESTFLLALVTFLLQLGGIIIGVIVTASKAMEGQRKYRQRKKKEDKDEQESETGWME
jgi:membrane protein implicated in regulation of membrane protease activity